MVAHLPDLLIKSQLLGGRRGSWRPCGVISEIESYNAFCEPTIERGEDGFANGRAVLEDIDVPEADDRIALVPHELVADAIMGAVCVLRTVDFDDEPSFTAGEVSKIRANR